MNKNYRAFHENPTGVMNANGHISLKYATSCPINMDIADLIMSHFGQNVDQYDPNKLWDAIEKFNEYYGTELKMRVNLEALEAEYAQMWDESEYEFKSAKEFEAFWNKHSIMLIF